MSLKKQIHLKRILLLFIVIAIVLSIYYLESMKAAPETLTTEQEQTEEILKDGLYPLSPELAGIDGYLNTDGEAITIESLRGKVVLIDFWTYTCINCIRTLPFLTSWDEKYKDDGLVIIGVHTPEFEFEKEYGNVQAAIDKYNIQYPVVQDNNFGTWRAFENRYWPRKYLIDAEGFIRYDHIGEGAYEETEAEIQKLLAEIGNDVSDIELTEEHTNQRYATTPELYAGYVFALPRGQNVGNGPGIIPDKTVDYTLPQEVHIDTIYLSGEWKSNADNLELTSDNGVIVLVFRGQEVNIVAEHFGTNQETDILINGQYVNQEQAGNDVTVTETTSTITVTEPDLYNIFRGEQNAYLLEIGATKGFTFNAFTFG